MVGEMFEGCNPKNSDLKRDLNRAHSLRLHEALPFLPSGAKLLVGTSSKY